MGLDALNKRVNAAVMRQLVELNSETDRFNGFIFSERDRTVSFWIAAIAVPQRVRGVVGSVFTGGEEINFNKACCIFWRCFQRAGEGFFIFAILFVALLPGKLAVRYQAEINNGEPFL